LIAPEEMKGIGKDKCKGKEKENKRKEIYIFICLICRKKESKINYLTFIPL
jgi:hypothetical protein